MKTKRKWGKLSGVLLCGTMLAGLLSMTAFAQGTDIAIDETNFPDKNFRRIVKSHDIDGDGVLSCSEIESVTEIVCSRRGILSLKGIEHFTALEKLTCAKNQLSELDVSRNTVLKELSCDSNQLSSLDVSRNTALVELSCEDNQLSSLDVSQNTALEYLSCDSNQLSGLDVSQNTALVELWCDSNQLSELDVSHNTTLKKLFCGRNQLSKLDVSQNTALKQMNCCYNQLSELDLNQNTALKWLYCPNNQLSELDVSHNIALEYLDCFSNQFSELDVSQNTALEYLDCSDNQLTSLDVSRNFNLEELDCYDNQLTSLDLGSNGLDYTLADLGCSGNRLSSLDVSHKIALNYLYCSNNQLTSLDVSRNIQLCYLDCTGNQLTSLDLSQNTALMSLSCSNNQYLIEVLEDRIFDLSTLPGFDVSKARNWQGGTVDGKQLHVNDGVETVTYDYDCGNNRIMTFVLRMMTYEVAIDETNFPDDNFRKIVKSYDSNGDSVLSSSEIIDVRSIRCQKRQISNLKGIEYFITLGSLYCSNNQLSSLDVSNNTALEYLYCDNNQLISLDVSGDTALKELSCSNNQLSSLDVSKKTALLELKCSDNQLSSLDVSGDIALVSLRCSNNQLSSLDLSDNTALELLKCDNNRLISLDLSRNTELSHLYCDNNQYMIEVPFTRIFDLSTLPGFDVSKAGGWQGGTVDGKQLHINRRAKTVTYDYDCGNYHSVTFTLEVKVLPHTCVFDQKTIVDKALKTPADCTHDAVYYKSCVCGGISTSEEDTFIAKRTALGHNYRTAWSSDKTNHWHECRRCQDKKDEEAHIMKTYVTPATMTKAGTVVTKCSICKEVSKTKKIAAIETVKLSNTTYVYDGKTKTPGLTVKDSAGKTVSSKYYKVEKSSGRKNVGKYTYKITFKGNYKGTKTLSFVINPKGTELISLQAESKGFTARWKKQATQTTGYEIRYATNSKMDGAKIVKITKNSKVSQKITKLTAKKKYYVQIRTYKKINTATYYSGWSKTKTVTTRK